jgi:hypothetical protein
MATPPPNRAALRTFIVVALSLLVLVAVSLLIQLPATAKPPTNASSVFDVIARAWVGRWTCTETQSGKPAESWTETTTLYGDKWLKSSGTYPPEGSSPATGFESVLGYDAQLHQWVTVTFLANGGYGIDRSASPPTSFVQIWVNAYPIDPHSNIPVTVVMTKNTWTVDGGFTKNGKRIRFHWNCAKQSK